MMSGGRLGVSSVLTDDRPIIELVHPRLASFKVGINSITRIECYPEAGHIWFAVYKSSGPLDSFEFLYVRVDGTGGWIVYYA